MAILRNELKTIGDCLVVDFNDEKWSEKDNEYIKIENLNDFELTGIKYYPNYE